MPSQAEIRCECAFTYMNARSRRNLSDAAAAAMTPRVQWTGKGGALDRVIGNALSGRTIVTCTRGVSDPRAGRVWGEEGGRQMGVAHAPLAPCSVATAARTPKPAAQSAAGARGEAADWQEDKASVIVQGAMRTGVLRERAVCQPGNGAPEFPFPHPVPLSSVLIQVTRQEERGCVALQLMDV